MIGSFITRALVMAFGYAYPAYECYKAVEKNKPEIEQLRFWCQYWILVALLTVFERIGDTFISWYNIHPLLSVEQIRKLFCFRILFLSLECSSCRVPMYSEAKLAFFIYLWYPKTKGTTYVYDSFFRPYVAKHESEIDRNLSELKTRAGDVAVLYWQRAASYGQTRIVDILQYVAAQSTPAPPPAQQRPGARVRQTAPANHQPAAATEIQAEDPPSPTSRSSLSQQQKEVAEMSSSQVPKAVLSAAGISTQNPTPQLINQSAAPAETEPMQINAANESENPSTEETVMEESIRVTRGRLRKNRSTAMP
ncbi:HVA22-like protein i isoform X1 [Arachis hypogaea]|uniref:HVA22-like protein i isoform X1 n=1 Tax=Arachis hypogaea TaxID=3818 RepID=UPI003B21E0C0|nr:HVA22-like protein i [Arachis hypogaea]